MKKAINSKGRQRKGRRRGRAVTLGSLPYSLPAGDLVVSKVVAATTTSPDPVAAARLRRPFRLDEYSGYYIWDADGKMAADFGGEGEALRARGWGRLHSSMGIDAAGPVMDEWAAWVELVVGDETDRGRVVELMNGGGCDA